MTPYVSYGGCGCCDRCPDVEILGKYVMPDGRQLVHIRDASNPNRTWWLDVDLAITWLVMD